MPLLVLLFLVVPLLELWAILQVGDLLGLWPTLALLIGDSVLGAILLRSQGRASWRRFNEALASGRPPAREVLDGALVIVGAAFLLTPGFLTDGIGFLLLAPPSRALARRTIVKFFSRRFAVRLAAPFAGGVWSAAARRRGGAAEYDVEGTATEQPPADPSLPPRSAP